MVLQLMKKKIKPRELSDVKPGGLGTYFINRIMDEVNGKNQIKIESFNLSEKFK